ncbi:hypothetical protein B9Z55_015681 [Caenorhabditis nigoni]|uniref:Uncharacterized protein n=1 Tax=Caenorhabditis nigoni TaxID=1611254 RepID=A0A2G5UBA1_9PELO|nr:hypothetical protein B9Z55_015681 [Caenorhabditis nigoni]
MDDDLNKDLESVWAQFLKKRDLIHLVHLEDADRSNWSDELQDKLEELNRFSVQQSPNGKVPEQHQEGTIFSFERLLIHLDCKKEDSVDIPFVDERSGAADQY